MEDLAVPLAVAVSILVVVVLVIVIIQGEARHRDRRRHTEAGETPVPGRHNVADRPADAGAEAMHVVGPGDVTPSDEERD